jgi:hypothetical protein
VDLRLRDRDDDLRVLFRARLRPPRLAAFVLRLAERRALFLAPFRAAFFLPPRLAELLVAFLRDRLPERDLPPDELERLPPIPDSRLVDEDSPKSKDDGVDAGEGEGVLSEGRGSIHPEPDQPISI